MLYMQHTGISSREKMKAVKDKAYHDLKVLTEDVY